MRFFKQSLQGLFVAAVSFGLLIFAAFTVSGAVKSRLQAQNKPPQAQERAFAVNVVRAQSGTQQPVLETYGKLQSLRRLELRATSAGRIVELTQSFVDGGAVKAGELLVLIDPAKAQSTLERAKLDLEDAQANLSDAKRNLALAETDKKAAQGQAELRQKALKRQQNLKSRGAGTSAAVEAAELALSSAEQAVLTRAQNVAQAQSRIEQASVGLKRAKTALADAQRNLSETRITAAFDGLISAPTPIVGAMVNVNERLGVLVDPERLEVSFRLSTAQYGRLLDAQGALVNAQVQVRLQSADTVMHSRGKITRVSAASEQEAAGRMLFAQLEGAGGLKAGDFVSVLVQEPELPDVIRLPTLAMDAKQTVLVVGQEDRLEELPVTLLRRQGDDILIRGEGLAGRDVVTVRSPLLGAGISVTPLRAGTPEAAQEMITLDDAQRAKLIGFVTENEQMPAPAKSRILKQLQNPQVPAQLVSRLEQRMKG